MSWTFLGSIVWLYFDNKVVNLTKPLDKKLGSNLSFTESWLDKSIDVFNTVFAFFESHKVNTIIRPAANSNKLGVGTFLDITSMLKSAAGTPETTHAS